MNEVNDALKVLSAMPVWALVATVVVAAFALAGYAIYVVSAMAKGRK
jgi:hypothetical protein